MGELGELLEAGDLFDQPVRSAVARASACAASWPPACCTSPRSCSSTSRRSASTCWPSRRFRDLLVRLNDERGTTIFLTSHDVADVEAVAERVVVMNHGAVIYDDAVAAMRRTLLATKLVEVGLAAPVAAPAGPDGVTVVEHTDTGARLSSTRPGVRSATCSTRCSTTGPWPTSR